ncbi:MAG TPA: SGNH/GDSL hydrolase family protein [Vicinamibacterales bacterium]|nr:SGNH/GDSL hydrolase family protein [Vicinamibacterales bacterium]
MRTIVAIGDSTTAGTPGFASPLEAPPDGAGDVESQYAYWLMQIHADWRVLNRGVNGERSDQIRARFTRDVLDATPDAVVILAGVNDIYQGRAAASVERELAAMYAAAAGAHVPVVAATILPFDTATPEQNTQMYAVNAWIVTHAASHGLVCCDTRAGVAAPGTADRLVSSPDHLHPSPDGYRLMALVIEPAVKRALEKAHPLL